MENQPNQPLSAGRQWFRLASLARREALGQGPSQGPATATPGPTAPAPAPGPAAPALASRPAAPRIPLARLGSFTPQPQLPQQPTPQQPTQQVQQEPPVAAESQQPPTPEVSKSPTPPSPRSGNPSRAPTPPPPLESLKVIKQSLPTPPESPTIRKLKPIKAPPPYPEPEPKPQTAPNPTNKFTQQSNGSVKAIADVNGKPPVYGNSSHTDTRALPPSLDKRETTNNGVGMTTALKKKDDYGEMKVISMAGENMGAYMELGSSQHVNRKQLHGYSLQNQTKGNESHNEEVTSEQKKKDKGKSSTAEGKPMVALVNSNVQSVNNSILFRSSCTEKSPGVHMTIVRGQRQPKLKSTHHQ